MIASTKKLKAGGLSNGNAKDIARRGGGLCLASDGEDAATNQPLGDSSPESGVHCAEPATGDVTRVTELRPAGRKSNGRSVQPLDTNVIVSDQAAGVSLPATEGAHASRKNKRRSQGTLEPQSYVNGRAGGEPSIAPEVEHAPRRKSQRRSKISVPPSNTASDGGSGGDPWPEDDAFRASICRALQELQRRKAATLKSRIMIDNQLAALVSTEMGYHAGMEEADRKKLRAEAEKLIKAIDSGDAPASGFEAVANRVSAIVQSTRIARNGFDTFLDGIEKEMVRLAKQLPAAQWCEHADRRGFGLLSLATVVGETGDLSLYANPAKAWKRLGLAPFQGKMPSTWRKQGGLSAEQWTEIGYSPRRRSIMFVVGENIVKQNKGPYRARYDEAKATAAANHSDWTPGRCHWHAMLLATKRLVRDLWKEWHKA